MKITLSMRISRNKIKTTLFKCALFAFLFLSACTTSISPNSSSEIASPESPSIVEVTQASHSNTPTIASSASASSTTVPGLAPETIPMPAAQIPDGDFRSWVLVVEGFRQPLYLTNAGDGSNRLFVVGQQGQIWLVENGQVLDEAYLDIRGRVNSNANEQGLLGLAFHSDYENNGFFFVNYTDASGATTVSRFSRSDKANRADPESESILIQIAQPFSNHNGGHIEFGPDGYLYIGMGDGGSAGDPQGNGQDPNTLLGALLRIDIDSSAPYAIPPDNPYAEGGGRAEIWAIGLRNPWRFSFDSHTGDLFIGDVGQQIWEEIDFLPAGISGGANLGWNYFEGNHAYEGSPPSNIDFVPPVAEYDHSNFRCSITGGLVYRGSLMPEMWGVYLFGDFCNGELFALLRDNNGRWQSESVYNLPFLITSFGADESGEIYLLDRNGGLYNLR